MYDLKGHKIEICGIHGPKPRDEKFLKEEGIDLSDIGQLNAFVDGDPLKVEDIAVIVWGEDLARVPLLAFNHKGEIIFKMPNVDDSVLNYLQIAASAAAMSVELDQKLAEETRDTLDIIDGR